MVEKVLTGLLVLAVLAGVAVGAWLMARRGESSGTEQVANGEVQTPQPVALRPPATPADTAEPATTFIVYYFHRTLRCETCLTIEELADVAVHVGFGDALEEGRLQWRVVNIEEPGSERFESDFQLERQAVVLVELAEGEMIRWKSLPQIWNLFEDKAAFQEYIWGEVAEFLGG